MAGADDGRLPRAFPAAAAAAGPEAPDHVPGVVRRAAEGLPGPGRRPVGAPGPLRRRRRRRVVRRGRVPRPATDRRSFFARRYDVKWRRRRIASLKEAPEILLDEVQDLFEPDYLQKRLLDY